MREAVALELEGANTASVVVVDDGYALDEAARFVVRGASEAGAKLVVVGARDDVMRMAMGRTRSFEVPQLDARTAEELVKRAVPSVPDALRAHLVERLEGRPGKLRAFVKKAGGHALVSPEDIDAVFAASSATAPPGSGSGGRADGDRSRARHGALRRRDGAGGRAGGRARRRRARADGERAGARGAGARRRAARGEGAGRDGARRRRRRR